MKFNFQLFGTPKSTSIVSQTYNYLKYLTYDTAIQHAFNTKVSKLYFYTQKPTISDLNTKNLYKTVKFL